MVINEFAPRGYGAEPLNNKTGHEAYKAPKT